jgi:hypothetical protein
MADVKVAIVDNSKEATAAELSSLDLRRSSAFKKLEDAKKKSPLSVQQRKDKAKVIQDGRIAAKSVLQYCAFLYAEISKKSIGFVPMSKKTAVKLGIKLVDEAVVIKTSNGRLLGLKSVGKMKTKKVRVSYGMSIIDRKTPTKGKKTGRTGRSRALSKGLVRRWITVSVPTDASNIDVLSWVSGWKKVPQLLEVGEQIFPLKSKQSGGKAAGGEGKPIIPTT